jgi:hypothetical protein
MAIIKASGLAKFLEDVDKDAVVIAKDAHQ